MRMASYMLVVDGESPVDQLRAKNPQLPSMSMVLQGLMEQGFLEVASSSANVVSKVVRETKMREAMAQLKNRPAPGGSGKR